MENKTPTPEEILGTIRAARDSAWVIDSTLGKENVYKEDVESVQRNVGHLELVMSSEHIVSSGEDLSDLTLSITEGNAFIQENQTLLQ